MLMYNQNMDQVALVRRQGFTIIEVMLFLAVSGFLLVGILAGTGSSLANQRYKDAVQDLADILRSQYSYVSETQVATREFGNDSICYGLTSSNITEDADGQIDSYFNTIQREKANSISGRGRTNCVVYGVVVTLSNDRIQTTTLIGEDYRTRVKEIEAAGGTIDETKSDLAILSDMSANNLSVDCSAAAVITNNTSNSCRIRTAGALRTSRTKWSTNMLTPKTDTTDGEALKATVVIFRSPRDGAIRTYAMNDVIRNHMNQEVDYEAINAANNGSGSSYDGGTLLDHSGIHKYFAEAANNEASTTPSSDPFNQNDVIICVGSADLQSYSSHRRMIRIRGAGHSSSAVELVDMDNEETNLCQ